MERPILDLRGERFAAMTKDQKAKAVYGGKFRLVGNLSEWTRQNPEEAQAVRAVASDLGLVGPNREQRIQNVKDAIVPPREVLQITPEVEKARIEFPEAVCREMFRGSGAERLHAVDPDAYARLKLSAASFDVIAMHSSYHISERARGHQVAPTQEPEKSPEEKAGLERTASGFAGTTHAWADLLVANATKK